MEVIIDSTWLLSAFIVFGLIIGLYFKFKERFMDSWDAKICMWAQKLVIVFEREDLKDFVKNWDEEHGTAFYEKLLFYRDRLQNLVDMGGGLWAYVRLGMIAIPVLVMIFNTTGLSEKLPW